MIQLAVFDLDGTLVDTPSAITAAFTATFESERRRPPSSAAIRATIGLPLAQAFAELLDVPVTDPVVPRCMARYRARFAETVLPKAAELLYPGVAPGLDALRARGVVLAVATSKYVASADALLVAAGIRPMFALVVGADQVARPKPHPDMGRYVLDRLGVDARRSVMVGDTTHDIGMAVAAGMQSIAVTYGVHDRDALLAAGPTWVADGFADVVAHVTSESEPMTATRTRSARAPAAAAVSPRGAQ
ncbi:MAG TPA: HAD family hydrolase [Actinomycetota bacterium]|nr:HAD family hydrolase [Actinomycetota bacterium]